MYTAPMPMPEPRAFVTIMNKNAIKLIFPFAFGSNAAAPAMKEVKVEY